jgi:hypothetical protein
MFALGECRRLMYLDGRAVMMVVWSCGAWQCVRRVTGYVSGLMRLLSTPPHEGVESRCGTTMRDSMIFPQQQTLPIQDLKHEHQV